MRSSIFVLMFVVTQLATGLNFFQCNREAKKQMKATEGFWQFERITSEKCTECPREDNTYAFKLEGEYVTLRLLEISLPQNPREDSYYRLKSKWENDVLYILLPIGQWSPFLLYKNDELLNGNEGNVQHFKHIAAKDLDPDEAGLLLEREPFEYQK